MLRCHPELGIASPTELESGQMGSEAVSDAPYRHNNAGYGETATNMIKCLVETCLCACKRTLTKGDWVQRRLVDR